LAPEDPLLVRAEAARRLLREDVNVDPLALLAAVVWPTKAELEHARQRTPAEDLERMRELRSLGLSHLAISRQLHWPRPTISDTLRREQMKTPQLSIW
jgi:hypothetical protein